MAGPAAGPATWRSTRSRRGSGRCGRSPRTPDAFPWSWTPQLVDEWLGDLRAVRGLRRSTMRNYQEAVRLFCGYVTDPAYGWAGGVPGAVRHPPGAGRATSGTPRCTSRTPRPTRASGRSPAMSCRRCSTTPTTRSAGSGRPGARAGCRRSGTLPLFKVAYGFGLRRNETAMLDTADFGPNPHAPEFGELGVCYVRLRQGDEGLAAQAAQRADGLAVGGRRAGRVDRARSGRCCRTGRNSAALWPSERGPRIGCTQIDHRFAAYRDALGSGRGPGLPLAAPLLRHPPDRGRLGPAVRPAQAGHEHASTTSIYTCVSSDFRTRTLRRALDATMAAALQARTGRT